MAFQGYRSRSDQTVSSNAGTKRVAHPTAPELEPKSGAENLSPAPVRQYDREAEQAWGRNDDARQNPGGNAYGGPSSLSPGQKAAPATINPMAPKDQVLENVLAQEAEPHPAPATSHQLPKNLLAVGNAVASEFQEGAAFLHPLADVGIGAPELDEGKGNGQGDELERPG